MKGEYSNDFQKVWQLLARNDSIRYFSKHQDRILAGVANSVAKLNAIVSLNPEWNWYITLNPTRARASLKARSLDVTEWRFILIDIDPLGQGDPEAALNFLLDKHQLRSYCAILNSGRGWQAWVSLRPMLLSSESDSGYTSGRASRSHVESVTKAWLHSLGDPGFRCKVDTSCSDLARVARLPGTTNHKTGRPATLVAMPSDEMDTSQLLDMYPPPERISHAAVGGLSLPRLLPYLTETASHFLCEGVREPGRHATAYAAARSLYEAGIPPERALDLIQVGASLCNPPLPIRDAARAVRNAYSKGIA